MIRELAACGVVVLGDQCYLGEEHIRVPDRTRTGAAAARKDANTPASSVRPPSTSTQLKARRILRKLRRCPWLAGQFAEANHLQTHEIGGRKFPLFALSWTPK